MAHFRLEAEFDAVTRSYYVEIFYPAKSTTPLIRTKAKYDFKDVALNEGMLLVGRAFTKPVRLDSTVR